MLEVRLPTIFYLLSLTSSINDFKTINIEYEAYRGTGAISFEDTTAFLRPVVEAKLVLSFAVQQAIPLEFSGKCGTNSVLIETECLNTRFALPTLLCADTYS